MIRRLCSVFILWIFCLLTPNSLAAQDIDTSQVQHSRDSIILGRISNNPKKHYKHLKPMADYLASNLGEFGIKRGEVVFAENNQQMLRYLKQGKVDVVSETVFSAVQFAEQADVDIVLRRHKKGVAEYSSLMFAQKGSNIESVNDLIGKTIAFQDSGSTSAFFIPAAILIQQGYKLYQLDSPREKPPADGIGFVFARKEINISAWVNKGIVDAGAFSDLNWSSEEDMPTRFRDESTIIYQSIPFPRAVEMLNPALHPVIQHKIVHTLINAHDSALGQKALTNYQNTTRFDELSYNHESIQLASELSEYVSEHLSGFN